MIKQWDERRGEIVWQKTAETDSTNKRKAGVVVLYKPFEWFLSWLPRSGSFPSQKNCQTTQPENTQLTVIMMMIIDKIYNNT